MTHPTVVLAVVYGNLEAYSWGVGEDESGDGLYCGFEGVVGAAVISAQNTPDFKVRYDTLNEVADTIDGRVVSPVAVGEFTIGGLLHGGDHPQSNVAFEAYSQNGQLPLETHPK